MCPCVHFPNFLAQFCHNFLMIVGGAGFSKSAGMISTSGVLLFGNWLIAHTISSWRKAGSISASLSSSSLLLAYSSSIYNCHLSWYLVGQTVFSLACFDDTFMNSVWILLHSWREPSCNSLLAAYSAGPSKLRWFFLLLFVNLHSISLFPPICLFFDGFPLLGYSDGFIWNSLVLNLVTTFSKK